MKKYYVRFSGTTEVLIDSEDEDEIFKKAQKLINVFDVDDMEIIDSEDVEE